MFFKSKKKKQLSDFDSGYADNFYDRFDTEKSDLIRKKKAVPSDRKPQPPVKDDNSK